jgi:hypothetical protein
VCGSPVAGAQRLTAGWSACSAITNTRCRSGAPKDFCGPTSSTCLGLNRAQATRHILKREFEVYGKPEFERLAKLSNGHLYNLHHTPRYGLRHYEKTRPTAIQIGERNKPAPHGQPGFLRIDTVHQGDGLEGKGIDHINAVDELTQWEVVLATPRISEAWLMPLLESILQQFPFVVLNFHSDNARSSLRRDTSKPSTGSASSTAAPPTTIPKATATSNASTAV